MLIAFTLVFVAIAITIEAFLSRYEYYYKRNHYSFKHPYFMAHEKQINDLAKELIEHELESYDFDAPPRTTTKKAGQE
ncbi:MAG: hypothetical protein WCL21_19495 [Mariniphaga sp.]